MSNDSTRSTESAAGEFDDLIDQLLVGRAGPGYDEIRADALDELVSAGRPAHDALVARLDSARAPAPILHALGQWRDPASVAVLRDHLLGGDAPTAVTAAHVLAEHPAPAARYALHDGLGSSRDQTVCAVAHAFAQIGDISAIDALERRWVTASSESDSAIAEAIGRLRSAAGDAAATDDMSGCRDGD